MFYAADESHPEQPQIYSSLKSLLLELRKEGYVPQAVRTASSEMTESGESDMHGTSNFKTNAVKGEIKQEQDERYSWLEHLLCLILYRSK